MSGLNQFAAYLFSSGDAFFVGAALIALGRATTWQFRKHRFAKWLRLVAVLGVIFFALSMTPLPWWLYGLCLIPPLVSLNVPLRADDKARWPRIVRRASACGGFVELMLLASITTELIERHRLHVPPLATMPAEVHVIGDSLSAGIASEQEHLWPNLLATEWHIPVRNHAQAGATTASAFRQAEEIDCDDCLVLIEIGGNDLLSGKDSGQIEADLDRLLAQLIAPRRTLVMFELPVPPIPGGYEFARLQRRLAHRHAVRLIPRREFAKVLLTPGATTDGLHLSPSGHRALADLLLRTLFRPIFTDAVTLDDPQLASQVTLAHRSNQDSTGGPQIVRDNSRWEAQHSDAGEFVWLDNQRIAEVHIERDQSTLLGMADRQQIGVGSTGQVLLNDGRHVVAGGPKQSCSAMSQILIELQLHPAAPTGSSMYRSRDISAP